MSAATGVLIEHAFRGAHIQRILRLLLGLFFVGVLIFQPPDQHLALCWLVVICYALWSIAVASLGPGWRSALAALCVAGPVRRCLHRCRPDLDRRQLRSAVLGAISVDQRVLRGASDCRRPAQPVDLRDRRRPCGAGLPGIQLGDPEVDADPISEIVLRTGLLAVVGIGCVLLSRVQRSRVSTIARLLDERNDLLAEMVTIEQREQRDLAETCMTVLCNTCSPPVKSWRRLRRGIRRPWNGSILPWPRPPDCCAPR